MASVKSLQTHSESNPAQIQVLYDNWATGYDKDIVEWGYDAPTVAAAMLSELVAADTRVLDAGCGTGLTGLALRDAGFTNIDGIDFSAPSVQIARATAVYCSVKQIDLTELPTSLPAAEFGALICIGVMTYLPDVEATCREFCRLLKSDSPVILTQRTDLFDARQTQQAFDALTRDGCWVQLEVSDSRDYLPKNPDFDGIGVHYCTFRTTRP